MDDAFAGSDMDTNWQASVSTVRAGSEEATTVLNGSQQLLEDSLEALSRNMTAVPRLEYPAEGFESVSQVDRKQPGGARVASMGERETMADGQATMIVTPSLSDELESPAVEAKQGNGSSGPGTHAEVCFSDPNAFPMSWNQERTDMTSFLDHSRLPDGSASNRQNQHSVGRTPKNQSSTDQRPDSASDAHHGNRLSMPGALSESHESGSDDSRVASGVQGLGFQYTPSQRKMPVSMGSVTKSTAESAPEPMTPCLESLAIASLGSENRAASSPSQITTPSVSDNRNPAMSNVSPQAYKKPRPVPTAKRFSKKEVDIPPRSTCDKTGQSKRRNGNASGSKPTARRRARKSPARSAEPPTTAPKQQSPGCASPARSNDSLNAAPVLASTNPTNIDDAGLRPTTWPGARPHDQGNSPLTQPNSQQLTPGGSVLQTHGLPSEMGNDIAKLPDFASSSTLPSTPMHATPSVQAFNGKPSTAAHPSLTQGRDLRNHMALLGDRAQSKAAAARARGRISAASVADTPKPAAHFESAPSHGGRLGYVDDDTRGANGDAALSLAPGRYGQTHFNATLTEGSRIGSKASERSDQTNVIRPEHSTRLLQELCALRLAKTCTENALAAAMQEIATLQEENLIMRHHCARHGYVFSDPR